MPNEMVVDVSPRQGTGKNESRRVRAAGLVPGVVYGGGRDPVAVTVDPRKIIDILRSESGENTLFTLKLGGTDAKRVVMIRDYQRDPVKGRLVHVDFVRVDLTKMIEVKVPIHVIGTPIGVKLEGGLLDNVIREVSVSCLPSEIPGFVEIDASEVHVGQHLSIRDIKISDKIKILDDPDHTVLVVALPKAEAEPTPAVPEGEVAAAEPTEPEVIKKGKEAGGAEEPAADAKKTAEPKKAAEPKKGAEPKK